MANVRHQVGIAGNIHDIYAALYQPNGLNEWWATSTEGTPSLGNVLDLHFSDVVILSFKIEKLDELSVIELGCVSGPFPWHGSTLTFKLKQDTKQVWVELLHENPAASEDDFLYFSTKWPCYLLSLRDFIEQGKGRPYPNEIKIHVGD